jgi:predicted O-methyltransferase YrrM
MDNIIKNTHVQALTSILESIGERVEGNLVCDIHPRNWTVKENMAKIKNLQLLCEGKKNIIEIGVNACHSLLLMLLVNPDAHYILFDLNYHGYTKHTLQYIKEQFPSTTIDVIFGNSVETIHAYIAENTDKLKTFDFIHLDGGHTEDIFGVDYENCKKLLSNEGIVVFDDYNIPAIQHFLNKKVATDEIQEYKNKNMVKTNLHFVYKYVDNSIYMYSRPLF